MEKFIYLTSLNSKMLENEIKKQNSKFIELKETRYLTLRSILSATNFDVELWLRG